MFSLKVFTADPHKYKAAVLICGFRCAVLAGPGSAEELKAVELPGWGVPEAAIAKVNYLLPRSEVARRLMQVCV
jgi:hypothetical protein